MSKCCGGKASKMVSTHTAGGGFPVTLPVMAPRNSSTNGWYATYNSTLSQVLSSVQPFISTVVLLCCWPFPGDISARVGISLSTAIRHNRPVSASSSKVLLQRRADEVCHIKMTESGLPPREMVVGTC